MVLLDRARAGDRAGMGELAGVVWRRLHPFVFRITLRHDVTEDVLQETLLAMICGVESLREPERFWPWMYRIAYAKTQDAFRKRRRQASVERVLQDCCHADGEWAGADSLLDSRVYAETLERVATAVERLHGRHRDIVRLRCYEDLPYTEIASRTTPQRARVRFHRAKASLRTSLACSI
jgi:RNA polymerase sigma factor (sigma-70 family)